MAAKHGHADVLELLLAQPGCAELATQANNEGKAPISVACTQVRGGCPWGGRRIQPRRARAKHASAQGGAGL
jgi:hypothetical protein